MAINNPELYNAALIGGTSIATNRWLANNGANFAVRDQLLILAQAVDGAIVPIAVTPNDVSLMTEICASVLSNRWPTTEADFLAIAVVIATLWEEMRSQLLADDVPTLIDEFMGGTASVITSSTSNANIGECNWNLSSSGSDGTLLSQTSTAQMQGWYLNEANPSSIMGPHLGPHPAISGGILIDNISWFEWRGTFNGPIFPAADGVSRFGLGLDSAQSGFGSAGIYFEYPPATSGFIRTVSKFEDVETSENTSVQWEQGAVYDMKVVLESVSLYKYYINGILVSTHNESDGAVTIPSLNLVGFMCQSEATEFAAHQLGMDRFKFRGKSFTPLR